MHESNIADDFLRRNMHVLNITDNKIVLHLSAFNRKGSLAKFGESLVKIWKNGISFSRFKMAAATTLDSGNQAFFDA